MHIGGRSQGVVWQALAYHGGLAFARHHEHTQGLKVELGGTSVQLLEEARLDELYQVIPEGLCRVVNSHLEAFGGRTSSLITVLSGPFTSDLMACKHRPMHQKPLEPLARVMIVDAHAGSRKQLKDLFEPLDIEVIEVKLGKTAMDHLADQNTDMIFYDMNSKDIDGFNFARWLRRGQVNRQLPLILCANEISKEVLLKAKQCGMSDLLLRPPSSDKLKTIVKKYLPEVIR